MKRPLFGTWVKSQNGVTEDQYRIKRGLSLFCKIKRFDTNLIMKVLLNYKGVNLTNITL
jgi:hypothetical protein